MQVFSRKDLVLAYKVQITQELQQYWIIQKVIHLSIGSENR